MTRQLECVLAVGKDQVTRTMDGKQRILTTLSGVSTVDVNIDGTIFRDEVEVQLTMKTTLKKTPAALGIELGFAKRLKLSDVNRALSEFSDEDPEQSEQGILINGVE